MWWEGRGREPVTQSVYLENASKGLEGYGEDDEQRELLSRRVGAFSLAAKSFHTGVYHALSPTTSTCKLHREHAWHVRYGSIAASF